MVNILENHMALTRGHKILQALRDQQRLEELSYPKHESTKSTTSNEKETALKGNAHGDSTVYFLCSTEFVNIAIDKVDCNKYKCTVLYFNNSKFKELIYLLKSKMLLYKYSSMVRSDFT